MWQVIISKPKTGDSLCESECKSRVLFPAIPQNQNEGEQGDMLLLKTWEGEKEPGVKEGSRRSRKMVRRAVDEGAGVEEKSKTSERQHSHVEHKERRGA